MNIKFETFVEKLKYEAVKEVAKAAFDGKLNEAEEKIPLILSPGPKPTYRDSIASERNIAKQRIQILTNKFNGKNIINVITDACDKCPTGGYTVTSLCRGCIGHACAAACPRNCITIDDQHHAHIDKSKCVNCGLCAKACPYGVILNLRRPCQKACHTGAISMDKNLAACIDSNKCINCGACMYKCPFGAIVDTSYVLPVINEMKKVLKTRQENKDTKNTFCAVLAPAIISQFAPCTLEQINEALIQLGFTNAYEAALGADIVAWNEGKELVEKKLLTSSCCPAFVKYIKQSHPELHDKISHNLSPMGAIAKTIKEKHPNCKICFIGPCTAKKMEITWPEVSKYVDYAMTFTELNALFGARDIQVEKLKGIELNDATEFGRGFAKCGGLSSAVVEVLKELDVKDFKLSSISCSGIEKCIQAIDNLAKGDKTYNFIEGMACEGGCIGGPGNLTHNTIRSKFLVEAHGKKAKHKTVKESIDSYNK